MEEKKKTLEGRIEGRDTHTFDRKPKEKKKNRRLIINATITASTALASIWPLRTGNVYIIRILSVCGAAASKASPLG